jgi:TonB family protein
MTRLLAVPVAVLLLILFTKPRPQGAHAQPCVSHIESLAYETLARQAALQGDVALEIEINTDGSVSNVRVLSGHPLLAKDAEENIKLWRFQSGHATPLKMSYEFRLAEQNVKLKSAPVFTYESPDRVRISSSWPTPDHGKGDSLP